MIQKAIVIGFKMTILEIHRSRVITALTLRGIDHHPLVVQLEQGGTLPVFCILPDQRNPDVLPVNNIFGLV